MKDLIAKLQLDANCALGAIWMHIDAREKHIAELESELAKLRAGTQVVAGPVTQKFNCHLTIEGAKVIGSGGENPILHVPGGTVVDLSGYTLLAPGASLPANTDKLREALKMAMIQNSCDMIMTGEEMRQCEAALASATGQAPVREVPEGWKLTRCEDGTIIVSKNNIGGYAAWKDDSNIASSILYHFADEFLATVPASPVQTEPKP